MDMYGRIVTKAHIKSIENRRDSIIRNMRYKTRLLEGETGVCRGIVKFDEKNDFDLEYPRFLRQPADTYIMAHQIGYLEVRIVGTPKPQVKWYKNWQLLTENSRIKIHHYEPDIYVLEIHDAKISDMGLYACCARNAYGCVTASATLRVVHLEIEDYPRFLKRPESVNVKAGHNARLEASITGVPMPEVKWFKNFLPIKDEDRVQICHYDPDIYTLNIYNAQSDDSGLYTCKARNDIGSISSSVMVHIEGCEKLCTFKCHTKRMDIDLDEDYVSDWQEDLVRIRRQTQRIIADLNEMKHHDLLHKKAAATYFVKKHRQSFDYYDSI